MGNAGLHCRNYLLRRLGDDVKFIYVCKCPNCKWPHKHTIKDKVETCPLAKGMK